MSQLVHFEPNRPPIAAFRSHDRGMFELDRPFRVADAVRHGISRESLRTSAWDKPFHGVRAPSGSLFDIDQVCAAYSTKMPIGSLFSGITAARLWKLPLPAYAGDGHIVEVAARAPRRAPQGVGVIGSQYDSSRVSATTLRGLPVLSAVDTWCSLAASLDPVDLTAVADHLLGAPGALTRVTHAKFAAAIGRRRAGRGAAAMRWAFERARTGAWSRTETLTRLVLESAGIPAPSLNHRIVGARRTVYVDLAWPEVRFGLEYDGDHHRRPAQFLDDISRQELIQDEAWLLMRMTRRDLFEHPDQLSERVARRLSERGWRGIRLDMRHLVRPRP